MIPMSKNQPITAYFMLVILLSIPFYVLGAFIDLTKYIPIQVPISALMVLCPMLAAIILTTKPWKKEDLRILLNRILDVNKIRNKWWLLVATIFIPVLMFLSYLVMIHFHIDLPKPEIKISSVVIFACIFFIGSIGEEVGWTGFVTDPLQQRFGAWNAALIIGIFWAVWYMIPYMQAHRTANWIVWQCIGTVALRIIMVRLYDKTNKSLFAMIVCYTTIIISVNIFPKNGSHYDPYYFGIALISVALIIRYFGFRIRKINYSKSSKLNS